MEEEHNSIHPSRGFTNGSCLFIVLFFLIWDIFHDMYPKLKNKKFNIFVTFFQISNWWACKKNCYHKQKVRVLLL